MEPHHKIESLGIEALLDGYEKEIFTPVDVVNAVYDRIEQYADKAVWVTLAPRDGALRYAEHLVGKLTGKSQAAALRRALLGER